MVILGSDSYNAMWIVMLSISRFKWPRTAIIIILFASVTYTNNVFNVQNL